MATFYLDYEAGSDAADGTTFANRWKTLTSGATAARIAPGDTIRVMASPDVVSLAINGTWTNGPQESTTAITSSTNATPIVVTRTAHGLTTGDTVIVNAHTTNTKANGTWEANVLTADTFELTGSVGNGVGGATGTFRRVNNLRVKLASAVTQNIAVFGNQGSKANWTASADVTCSVSTADNKEGGECQSIAVAAAFTTGLAAYFATGTLDLSGYQQISFKIKQTAGTVSPASSLTLRLCSDTVGATAVDTLTIPVSMAVLNQWAGFTIDKGSALGSAIASIGFVANTDSGAQTFLLDNIIACKAVGSADALTLTSLIGKNNGEPFCAIASINGTRVMLDSHVNSRPTTTTVLPRGYSGTTETVTAYRRETIKATMGTSTSSSTTDMAPTDSGTAGSPITYSGGWNRTDMSTQTGETWWDGVNGCGGLQSQTKNFLSFTKLCLVRFSYAWWPTTQNFTTYSNCAGNHNTNRGLYCNQNQSLTGTFLSLSWNGDSGQNAISDMMDITVTYADGNHASGLSPGGIKGRFAATNARNNGAYGFQIQQGASECVIHDSTTAGNATAGVICGGTAGGALFTPGTNYMLNVSIAESTEVAFGQTYGATQLWSKNHDNVAASIVGFFEGATVYSETSVRHTASGRAWRIAVTSANRSSSFPFPLELGRVAVAASLLVTIKAWMRRTNTGLTHRLVCKGGQIGGVAADVTSAMTAAADTWEEVTITFTPNEAGVVAITTESYGGTTYSGYVDDMAVSQA